MADKIGGIDKVAIANELKKGIIAEKKLKIAMLKIASLQKRLEIRDTVLELVSEGITDIHDAKHSVERFESNPDDFAITKEAHAGGVQIDILNEITDLGIDTKTKDSGSAENEFSDGLEE